MSMTVGFVFFLIKGSLPMNGFQISLLVLVFVLMAVHAGWAAQHLISTMLSSTGAMVAFVLTPKDAGAFLLHFSFNALLFASAVQLGFLIGLETAHLGKHSH